MILVNLYGGPGVGKSTAAAFIFSQLKMKGVNVELVTEFAKDKVWEENKEVFNNQAYIFGKQYFKITRCMDKVDVIVTDSPLLLSIIYNDSVVLGEEFNTLVRKVVNSFNTKNYFLTRNFKYENVGRRHNEEEANDLQDRIYQLLIDENVNFLIGESSTATYNNIVQNVLDAL